MAGSFVCGHGRKILLWNKLRNPNATYIQTGSQALIGLIHFQNRSICVKLEQENVPGSWERRKMFQSDIPDRNVLFLKPQFGRTIACSSFFGSPYSHWSGNLQIYSHWSGNLRISCSFSTKSDPECKEDSNPEKPEKKLSLFKKFKQMYRDYWYVLVPVHVITSIFWFGGFYYLAKSGVDVVSVLEALGAGERITGPLKDSSAGYLAIAYALYKIATPARYTVTLGGTTVSIKYLKEWGYIKPIPPRSKLKEIYEERKETLKDRIQVQKDRIQVQKESILEKKDKLKTDAIEKAREIRGKIDNDK